MNDRKPGKLIPARPEAVADGDYMPRLPWRLIVPFVLVAALVIVLHKSKEQAKVDRLRSQILQVHEQELADASKRYVQLRDRLDAWIVEAASRPPERAVDERLKLEGLRAGNGLYLRIGADLAKKKETISAAAVRMQADAITRCLGLSPASARGIYEKGAFLLPEWVEDVHETDDLMTMRVKDNMLARHMRADLTGVLGLLRSDWFLLVLQQGPSRARDPVDVFLWDMRSGERLLSARVRSRGVLLPARILSKGLRAAPELSATKLREGAAVDCSIASSIRELTGATAASVSSAIAPTTADGGAPTGQPDAGVAAGAEPALSP